MSHYKEAVKRFFGIKSPLEKSIDEKLEALTNHGMIDIMHHQYTRYKSVTHFTLPATIHRSWLQR